MAIGAVTRVDWFTPGVGGIGAASLLSDLGHEVPTALLPRFLTPLGGSAAVVGVIEGIADGIASETLGKLERFHRTLKEWLHDGRPASDLE